MVLAAGAATLFAAELVVMSAGALEAGVTQLAAQYRRDTGDVVRIEIGNAPQLTARLAAGDAADVLIAPAAVVDQAIADRRAAAASRTTVGRVGVAVVVRAGAATPDVSSADALRRELLAADAVIYNQGSSGTYIETLLAQLGIADRVEAKTVRVLNGEAVMERLAAARGSELAFLARSDAIRATGLQYAGPLPAPLQNFTTYDAVVMHAAREPVAASAFLRFITTAAARRTLRDAGVE
ncbi:MAG: ABC transporter substrate-binding protein [Acidimicrobiia bacterium]|nr:ABC transporter substrate-binding protein [Acidimicrobiia bacterium]